jgi:hypothetical protein
LSRLGRLSCDKLGKSYDRTRLGEDTWDKLGQRIENDHKKSKDNQYDRINESGPAYGRKLHVSLVVLAVLSDVHLLETLA